MSSFRQIKQCARSLLVIAKIYRNDAALNVDNAYENRPSFVRSYRNHRSDVNKERWRHVDSLVIGKHFNEATRIVVDDLQAGVEPPMHIMDCFLRRLASSGDVERLNTIERFLKPDQKLKYTIDNRLCVAYNQSARSEEYIQYLADRLSNCQANYEIRDVGRRFPLTAHCILETCPQAIDSFRTMAEQYAQKDLYDPINVLWMYLFVNGPEEPAQQIWSKYLNQRPALLYKYIIMRARAKNDYHLVEKLTEQVADSNISPVAHGGIYSGLIDIYSALQMYEDGLAALDRAKAAFGIHYIHTVSLNQLQNGLKKVGMDYPTAE